MITEISRRFPAVANDAISNMAVLSLRGLSLLMSCEDRKDYGVSQIQSLIEYYSAGQTQENCETVGFINADETLAGWAQCKDLMAQQHYPCHTVESTWKLFATNHPDSFPNLRKLSMVAVLLLFKQPLWNGVSVFKMTLK